MKNSAMRLLMLSCCGLVFVPAIAATAATTDNVKITPLGSHDGEFCAVDRALILEDPDGTRILYDAGRTVRGAGDPRLGKIDAVLLSHLHGDHLGDVHQSAANTGSCAKPDFSVLSTPSSVTEQVALAKKATLFVGGEMASFFARRMVDAGGKADQVQLVRFGGEGRIGGVKIASVPAVHSNGLDPKFLDKGIGDLLSKSALTAYVGPAGGYVVTFSNGLVVYLSGDTGLMADHDLVVRAYYKPTLAVLNIGGTYTTGPLEAAHVINQLVRPNAVLASHANEVVTKDGKLLPGTKTMQFKNAVNVPTYLPLSGKTMEFNTQGICVAGC
jgi:L-ascorbate metabolism protein UlaG (beta-lactamase superfamily)